MGDAVFITDTRGDLVKFNDAFLSFHRCADHSACGRTLSDFQRVLELFEPGGNLVANDRWPVAKALLGESGSIVEYRVRRKDTGETWIGSYSFSPVRSPGGEVVGAVMTARDITSIRQAQLDLQASHEALQRLIAAQDKVQEEERKRIALELHDDLQQTLTAIRIKLGRIGGPMNADPASLAQLVDKIDALAAQALASTRRIVNDLRPQMLEDLGLVAALEMLARQFCERTGLRCTVQANAELEDALIESPQLATCLYRVTQEALNNVVKHARADSVDIRLSKVSSDWLSLRISDDGCGMSGEYRHKAQSFGIAGMSERLRAQGGTLQIDGAPGAGTTLEVLVPLAARTSSDEPSAVDPSRDEGEILDKLRSGRRSEVGQGLDIGGAGNAAWADAQLDAQTMARLISLAERNAAQAVIGALPGRAAMLDGQGVVRQVNRAWADAAAHNDRVDSTAAGPGVNYLELCRRHASSDPHASAALQALGEVLSDRQRKFVCDYPCQVSAELCWYRMSATRMGDGGLLVSHLGIDPAPAVGSIDPEASHADGR
jgi:PAS domain S-box-containing protein